MLKFVFNISANGLSVSNTYEFRVVHSAFNFTKAPCGFN